MENRFRKEAVLLSLTICLARFASADVTMMGLAKEQKEALGGLGWKETAGGVGASDVPHVTVMMVGFSEKSPLLDQAEWTAFRSWVEAGGRAVLEASEPAAAQALQSLGLKALRRTSAGPFHVSTLADDQLFEALNAAAPALLASPGGLLTNECPDAWPLLTSMSGEDGPNPRIVEIPLGRGGLIVTDAPLAASDAGRLLLVQLTRHLEESYRPDKLLAQMEKLTDIARTRAEEALSLVMTKAGSVSPNEMNSPKGDPWYRVPGSSGDRLVITPEIEAQQAAIKERIRALRRDTRRAGQEEPPDHRKIKLLQRDASQLADDALQFFNWITRV